MKSLLDYATTKNQQAVIERYEKGDGSRAIAEKMSMDDGQVRGIIRAVKRRAADDGFAPGVFNEELAENERFRARSYLKNEATGETVLTWYKTTREGQAAETIQAALERFQPKPSPKIAPPKAKADKDLLTLYTLTDFHLGMYAWAEETGDDWDTEIASRVLINAIDDMIAATPNSETAILNLQGDFLHWDGLDAVTPQNKHVLDADTRFGRMVDLSLDLTMWATQRLLRKHKRVRLIVVEGNHDQAGSAWLSKSMMRIFRNEKRIEVDPSEFPFYAYLHGHTMLGFHHGHKVKNKELPALFASEPRFRSMWGQANYTYIHTGHYHMSEQDMAEHGGAIVERHPTLAARDAYAARGGYVSRRAARAITYHVNDGETHRATVLPR
jgi:hypothetical protein